MTYHGQMAGICWNSHRPETTASGHLMIHLQKVKTMMAPDRFRPRTRGRHLPTYLSIYNTTIEPLSDHVVPHPLPPPSFRIRRSSLPIATTPTMYYLNAHLNPSAPPSAPYPNAKPSKPSNHPSRKPFSLNTLLLLTVPPHPNQPSNHAGCSVRHPHQPSISTPLTAPPLPPVNRLPTSPWEGGHLAIFPSSPPPPSSTLPPSLKTANAPTTPTTIPQSRQATSASHRVRARASSSPSPSQGAKPGQLNSRVQDA